MRGRIPWLTGACLALAVFVSRWPFRSRALFSWDSANFALAIDRIDIAAHRPHPPGYLAYVLAGRTFNAITGDPNTAFIVWNLIATAISVIVLAAFASQAHGPGRRPLAASLGVAAILVTSPLLWFYGEITEIYTSEMTMTLLVAYAAWLATRGRPTAIYWCVAALAVAATFKPSAAVLMFPLVAFAWWHQPSERRKRAAVLLVAVTASVMALFLIVEPTLFSVVSAQFTEATGPSRLIAGVGSPLRALNRNLRDTLLSMTAALGVVNALLVLVWLFAVRRLPAALGAGFMIAWALPQILLLLVIHIGRPGYVLPLLPVAALIISSFVSRQRPALAWGWTIVAATVNIAHFAVVTRPSLDARGGDRPYRSKTLVERALSDIEPLTWPTRFSIRESDGRVAQVLEATRATCPAGRQVIVVGNEPVDWRRLMWYVPAATAIRVAEDRATVLGIGRDHEAPPATDERGPWRSDCPILWLTADGTAPKAAGTAAMPLPGLGWTTPPGLVEVTAGVVSIRADGPGQPTAGNGTD